MSDELLPCPFCGGEADFIDTKLGLFIVECVGDDCIVFPRLKVEGYGDKKSLIASWNKRHAPDITELQAENVQLRERLAAVEGWEKRANAMLPILQAAIELVTRDRATHYDVTVRTGTRVVHTEAFEKLERRVNRYREKAADEQPDAPQGGENV